MLKVVATKRHILTLKCTKFDFGSSGGTYSIPPDILTRFKGSYTCKARETRAEKRKEDLEKRSGERKGKKKREKRKR